MGELVVTVANTKKSYAQQKSLLVMVKEGGDPGRPTSGRQRVRKKSEFKCGWRVDRVVERRLVIGGEACSSSSRWWRRAAGWGRLMCVGHVGRIAPRFATAGNAWAGMVTGRPRGAFLVPARHTSPPKRENFGEIFCMEVASAWQSISYDIICPPDMVDFKWIFLEVQTPPRQALIFISKFI